MSDAAILVHGLSPRNDLAVAGALGISRMVNCRRRIRIDNYLQYTMVPEWRTMHAMGSLLNCRAARWARTQIHLGC